jgi:hypothetical protein
VDDFVHERTSNTARQDIPHTHQSFPALAWQGDGSDVDDFVHERTGNTARQDAGKLWVSEGFR